ncbi:hypothetical protein DTO002I6_381 [Penicillium roqueforti]|nr:hypothetical protein DTO002I6_381 [Penicillium roqueforti]
MNQPAFFQMSREALPLALVNLLRIPSPLIFAILNALQPLLQPGDGSRNGADLFAMLRRSYVLRMTRFEVGARCDKSREQEALTEVAWDRLM